MTPQGMRLDYLLRERELRAKRDAELRADIERTAGTVFWGAIFVFACLGLGACLYAAWQGLLA